MKSGSAKKKKGMDSSTSAATTEIQKEQQKKAERGWNNHYVRRGTYNFALSKMQDDATTALKNMWDPTKSYQQSLKQMEMSKKDSSKKNKYTDKYGAVPTEVAVVWKKFTVNLKKDSEQWDKQMKSREEAKKWVRFRLTMS